VQTGPDIQQWQEAGTTITSLWMDLEAGMIVQITGYSLDRNPRQGEISVSVISQASGGGHLGRYRGGDYPTPRKLGPVTLTGVTGSLATHNMVVRFSYADGTGKLVPRTGHVTIVPRFAACATSQLQITFTYQGGVAGDEGGYLRFANTGTSACRLEGWPVVVAVTATGRTVKAARAVHGTMFGGWQYVPPLPAVNLNPGSAAYAVVAAGDVPPDIGGPTQRCPQFRWLRVTPPHAAGHVTVSAQLYERVYLPDCTTAPRSPDVQVSGIVPLRDLPH
jgi:hypothetical protein